MLTDAQWAKMAPHCRGKESDPGRSGVDNRRFVEAVLWIARTGSPWRDLPGLFGPWNTVFKRYRDWLNEADVLKRLSMRPRMSRHVWSGPVAHTPRQWRFMKLSSGLREGSASPLRAPRLSSTTSWLKRVHRSSR